MKQKVADGQMNIRQLVGNCSLVLCLIVMAVAYWNKYSWYQLFTPYGTLISAFLLTVAFFSYVDVKTALKDPVFWLIAATDLMALINIILVHSNFGALLTVFDVTMVFYLANKLYIPKKLLIVAASFMGFFFFYWTIDVKGYYEGYNTNYGGMVLVTGLIFTFIGLYYLKDYLRKKGFEKAVGYVVIFELFMFVWGYNIISWYRARCALLGFLVFAIIYFLPRKIWQQKWFYILMILGVTVGAIAFSGLYVWLGSLKESFNIQIFYKDILSGREEVWKELWLAFCRQPITGIGSAYELSLEWMEGVFEVHNGLLDILIVHGISVFIPVISLMTARLINLRKMVVSSEIAKIKLAGAMAIFVISFMENCFIVPPFLICLLLLLGESEDEAVNDTPQNAKLVSGIKNKFLKTILPFEGIVALICVIAACYCIRLYETDTTYIFPNEIMELGSGEYDSLSNLISAEGAADTILRTPTFSLREGDYNLFIRYKSDAYVRVEVTGNNACNYYFELVPTNGEYVEFVDKNLKLATPTEEAFLSYTPITEGSFTLEYMGVTSESATPLYTDYLLYAVTILIVGAFVIAIYRKVKKAGFEAIKKDRAKTVIIVLMCLFVVASMLILFATPIRRAVDIRCHLLRINGIYTGLLDRQFPVVLYPNFNNDFGQIGVLYPNVLLYFPAALRYFGVSLKTAYIYYTVLVNLLTMIVAYISFKYLSSDEKIAGVGALMYFLMPNRMRFNLLWGSVAGAGTALIFLPLVIAGMFAIIRKDKKMSFLMLPIGLWGMFTSHLVSTAFAVVILIILALVYIRDLFDKRSVFMLIASVAVFALMSLSTIVPFIDYYFEGFNSEALAWGNADTFAYEIGRTFTEFECLYRIADILLALLAVALILRLTIRSKGCISFMCMAIVGVLCITPIIPWRLLFEIPSVAQFLSATIQYPDRALTVAEPALTIVYMYIFAALYKKNDSKDILEGRKVAPQRTADIHSKEIEHTEPKSSNGNGTEHTEPKSFKGNEINHNADKLSCVLLIIVIFAVLAGCFADYYTYYVKGEKMLYDKVSGEIEWSFDDYLPKGTKHEWYYSDTGTISDESKINILTHNKYYTHITTTYTCEDEGEYLEYPLFYYKDYVATDELGNQLVIEKGDKNLVRVYIDKCSDVHTVNLFFAVKRMYKICFVISLLACLAVFALLTPLGTVITKRR